MRHTGEQRVRLLTQAAVNAAGVVHAQNPGVNLRLQLGIELGLRGLDVGELHWVRKIERALASGRWVIVDEVAAS